ncbi:MAG: hypothetical protein A3H45_12415 [Ignavibacteria bacterium RIFCSPLOWO2_02_FULL_55_14]|nr:MAG: hypothetical protein A3H45_12415 [Ignavibacteria bacterium RIFCSPLOWO2_02_FULL_55_14]
MTVKQRLIFLLLYAPIGMLIGIFCTVAYSLEFEPSVSVNWPIASLICVLLVAGAIIRENRDRGTSQDPNKKVSK